MNDSLSGGQTSRPEDFREDKNEANTTAESEWDSGWLRDLPMAEEEVAQSLKQPNSSQKQQFSARETPKIAEPTRPEQSGGTVAIAPLVMVETAFLASTASLIWLLNYYFPMGPLLRVFFPVPIALVYLRWGHRAAWMSALVSGLLLSVLMGPTRSLLFFIPYGLLGVLLGMMWRRRATWAISIGIGTLIGTIGFFFRFWLLSILLGEDLWVYLMTQITEIAEWLLLKLGVLTPPSFLLIQAIAIVSIFVNSLLYLFVVHLAAWVVLERLRNPIPPPPHWVQNLLDYEQ